MGKTLAVVGAGVAIAIAVAVWVLAAGPGGGPGTAPGGSGSARAPAEGSVAATRAEPQAERTVVPVVQPAAAAASGAGQTVVVISARYGAGDAWVDVTPQVQRLVLEHGLKLPRDLHKTFGADPVPGFMKYVEMSLVVNGLEMWVTVADSLQLNTFSLSTTPPEGK